MYIRALAGYENALQSENIPALETVCNLAVLYRDQGKTEEAKTMFQRASSYTGGSLWTI
jgi:Tfp pilus assembly protein PilF